MIFKSFLILKFFFRTDNGKFRKSFFPQLFGVYFGALIIFLTISVMEGIEKEIFEKISAFNYKYSFEISKTANNINYEKFNNYGKKSIVLLETKNYEFFINVLTYEHLEKFNETKISESLLFQNALYDQSSIIIGESLSRYYNISIGDEVKLSDILNINIVSGNYKSKNFIVSNIYDFKFLNYDFDNVIIKENNDFFLEQDNYIVYSDSNIDIDKSLGILKVNAKKFESLFNAIKFEKKLYILLGLATILISSLMILNNTIIIFIEKIKQINLLNKLGLELKKVFYAKCFLNCILSFVITILSFNSLILINYLNETYGLINYLFVEFPFDKIPLIVSFKHFILTALMIISLTLIATYISFKRAKLKYKLI
tara:strand:- start:14216 stop:15325 length:1110 start_codon:yes stop_codon:yes gene_type:complete